MASEIFKSDANFKAGGVVGGYSSADALEATNPSKIVFRINPTTKRLLVDVNGATTVTDGEAVDAADTGTLFLGTDGTNYRIPKTDSDGNLQVDVLTMPAVTIDTSSLATSAKQDTIIGHVDGIEGLLTTIDADTGNIVGYLDGVEGLLTTIDADTGNIATSVASIDSKTPALGQALAAGSVPVVLTAAQLSTLTPLATVAVTQSGTWDEVGINDSGNSITVDAPVGTPVFVRLSDGSSAITTLPVSLASVPSHAVTNAGTFVVQENGAALTALQLIDNAVSGAGFNITQFAGVNAVTGSGTATGALRVELPTNGTGTLATVSTVTTVSTVSALGTGTTGPQKAEDVASAGGDMGVAVMVARLDTPVANAGVSNDGDYTTPVLDNYRKLWVTGTVPEDTAHVAGEGIVMGGARRIDTLANSAGSSGDWATVNQTAEGALWVTVTPSATGGATTMNASSSDGSTALTSTAQVIKASAGTLKGYYIYNPNSSAQFVQFYNTAAASVTVGTTSPLFMITIPATSAANLWMTDGINFSNAGWSWAATSTAGGNGAPSTALDAVAWYI